MRKLYTLLVAVIFALGFSQANAGELSVKSAKGAYGTNVHTTGAYFHTLGNKSRHHAMHYDLPAGTVLELKWENKRTVVIVNGIGGSSLKRLNLSEQTATALGMKKIGVVQNMSYRVIAWPMERGYPKDLTEAQVDRILSGEGVGDVVSGVIATGETIIPLQDDEEGPDTARPESTLEVLEIPRNTNNHPDVLKGVDFASKVFGAIFERSAEDTALVHNMLKSVCGTESKCNPGKIHYTQNGGLSAYQGIGQLGKKEAKEAHEILKLFADSTLLDLDTREHLRGLVDRFDSAIRDGTPLDPEVDPRFDPSYGPLLLMAFHSSNESNRILALLKTFPRDTMYRIDVEAGVVPDQDGNVTAEEVHHAGLQSAQLAPGGFVESTGLVDLSAVWPLTGSQSEANEGLLRVWIVKPNEGADSMGYSMPGIGLPKTRAEAIARIVRNSEARYNAAISADNNAYRRALIERFLGVVEAYTSAWKAHIAYPNDRVLKQVYDDAEALVSDVGWSVRALLFDPGKTVYDMSEKGKRFRELLAQFRIAHFTNGDAVQMKVPAEAMRTLMQEQLRIDYTSVSEIDFSATPVDDVDARRRAEFLIADLKEKYPSIGDGDLAAHVMYRGLEDTTVFGELRKGSSDEKIGKAVALLMQSEGPIISFSDHCAEGEITEQCIVDTYLWGTYQRIPVRIDSAGVFTWKDITAALRAEMSVRDYVIGGMDERIKVPLYFLGNAMDEAKLPWGALAYYRGSERPAAGGRMAALANNSTHYGTVRVGACGWAILRSGSYGSGIAADLAAIDRKKIDARAEADKIVWEWMRVHYETFGFQWRFGWRDPAHIEPKFTPDCGKRTVHFVGTAVLEAQKEALRTIVENMKE